MDPDAAVQLKVKVEVVFVETVRLLALAIAELVLELSELELSLLEVPLVELSLVSVLGAEVAKGIPSFFSLEQEEKSKMNSSK